MPLTDVACRGAKPDPNGKPRKLTDGAGLMLFVSPAGGKFWRLRYRRDGKEQTLSLGEYPKVSLSAARALRDKAKKTLADGRDPANKADLDAPHSETFEAVARDWLAAQDWKPSHGDRVLRRFQRDVFPSIGSVQVADLTAAKILEMLRPVENRAPDIAGRLRQHVSAIMRFATIAGMAERDPATDLKGALRTRKRAKHMAALAQKEMPEFLWRLSRYDVGGGRTEEQTRLGIQLVAHTVVRTSELRFATWEEIEGDVWRIPPERMKMSMEHVVPLTPQSHAILARLKTLANGSRWILPGENRDDRPSSENRLLFAVYRLGYRSRLTIHGLRSVFSTIANESEMWSEDAIERQLAHQPQNKIRSAYNRGIRLEERRRMMTWWSDWLVAAERRGDKGDLSDLLD